MILEGQLPFDEAAYDFTVETPPKLELESQIELLKLRVKSDLPAGEKYEEPTEEC